MQNSFIENLKEIQSEGEDKALLISATGTGKTYAAAFALQDALPNKALFLVHREQIAKQAKFFINYKKLILQDKSKINAEVFLSGFEVIVSNAQLTEIETNKEISEAIGKYVNNLTDNINNLNNKQIDVLKIFKELFNENNHLKHFIFRQRDKLEFILKKVDELEKQKVEITEKDFKKLTQKRKK